MRFQLIFAFSCLPFFLIAQNDRIIVDAFFDDWSDVPVLINDSANDNNLSNVDFGELKVTNDEDFIFFKIDVGTEIGLQDNNRIAIFLDTDNNANTGISAHGIGSEIIFDFGDRDGTVRVGTSTTSIEHDDISLFVAPSVTGNVFEIAISRDLTFFGQQLFSSNTVKIVFEDDVNTGDRLPNASGGVSYSFTSENELDFPEFSIAKTDAQTFRVLSYNVEQDGLFAGNNQSRMERIFQAIQPDIIGFQEIYDNSSSQTAARIEDWLPSGAGEQWYHKKFSPDIICVSRYPIIDQFIIPGSNGGQNNGAFLIDLDEDFNTDLLFIVAHTPCCDNDFGRQEEVDAMMAFIRDSQQGQGDLQLDFETPIVIVGDMNLVGDKENFETLITGDIGFNALYGPDFSPDWDGTDLEDAVPTTTFTPLTFTWQNNFGSFFPGRLDVVLFTGSVLSKTNAFSLFTPALPSDSLSLYGLFDTDTPFAADHFPLVVDFKPKNLVAVEDVFNEKEDLMQLAIRPNPVSNRTDIQFALNKRGQVEVSIFDGNGKLIESIFSGEKGIGEHILQWKKKDLAAGSYFLKLTTDNGEITKQLIIQ